MITPARSALTAYCFSEKVRTHGASSGERFSSLDRTAARIEDYAFVGDCETAALISRGGSLAWRCWPRFDSGACCAALLGGPENGRWLVAPAGSAAITRRYRPDTLILETEFTQRAAVRRRGQGDLHAQGQYSARRAGFHR